MTQKIAVALVGAGAMGGALLRGWLEAGVIEARASAVFEPAPSTSVIELTRGAGVALNPTVDAARVDALVIAVKPQAIGDVLPRFAALARSALSLSVMAGVSLRTIAALLPSSRLVRAMPNLPSQIGAGAAGLFARLEIGPADRAVAETLMSAVGETVWVRSEDEIDFVTAISGSGPAYFFLMTEALAEAGAALGLDRETAARLARATLVGAGALVANDPRVTQELRRAVTSPGGTTAAALGVLDGEGESLRRLMKAAVEAAAHRARELSAPG